MSLAWHIAALPRQKRFPKLDKLLVRRKPKKPQTWEQMKTIAMMFNAMHGGEFRTKH